MPMILEIIVVVAAMIGAFFLAFVLMFVLAISLAPIERGLSNMIWDMTTPAARPVAKGGSFRDFSTKHNR